MGIEADSLAIAKVEEVRSQVISLATTTYRGCNYQHLRDLLAEREGIRLSRASVRRILQAAGVSSPRKQRAIAASTPTRRLSQRGHVSSNRRQ